MDDAVYLRVADVVWRIAPDRVILRHVNAADDTGADLMGDAALVWVALDEPATVVQIIERLVEEDLGRPLDEIGDVVGQLVAAGWLRASDRTSA